MKTKLDVNNTHHQILIATLASFVEDYGYTTKELFLLLDDSKRKLWSTLTEMEKQK